MYKQFCLTDNGLTFTWIDSPEPPDVPHPHPHYTWAHCYISKEVVTSWIRIYNANRGWCSLLAVSCRPPVLLPAVGVSPGSSRWWRQTATWSPLWCKDALIALTGSVQFGLVHFSGCCIGKVQGCNPLQNKWVPSIKNNLTVEQMFYLFLSKLNHCYVLCQRFYRALRLLCVFTCLYQKAKTHNKTWLFLKVILVPSRIFFGYLKYLRWNTKGQVQCFYSAPVAALNDGGHVSTLIHPVCWDEAVKSSSNTLKGSRRKHNVDLRWRLPLE